MIIKINSRSEMPIYLQLRNQIVKGIGKGELEQGEILPTVRQMAADLGVNAMTVSKAYQLLKNEGFLYTDRRLGSIVHIPENEEPSSLFQEKLFVKYIFYCIICIVWYNTKYKEVFS